MIGKKLWRTGVLIFFLTVMGLLVYFETQNITAQEDTVHFVSSNKQHVQEGYVESIEEMRTSEVDYAINLILEDTPKDFFTAYPVDESFLCWICTTFGENVIYDIAYNIYQGNYNKELWYEYTGNTMHVLWQKYCMALNYSSYSLENTSFMEVDDDNDNDNDNITIDFVGDIVFSDNWSTMQHAKEAGGVMACFSDEIVEELTSADVTIANNEFTYSDEGKPLKGKDYIFQSKTENVKYMSELGVDMVSLANNHIYDCGAEGLVSSLITLEAAGIETVGAGRNIEEASAVKYICVGGRKIAIVAATEIEKFSNFTREASVDSPGVLKTLNSERYCAKIREAAKHSDYVIAFVHWGTEGSDFYDYDQIRLAEDYVEAGADAVIGGHPHRLQGTSYIDGVPVIYSLGNFWLSDSAQYTAIAQLNINKSGKLSVNMIPCLQENSQVSMLTKVADRDAFYTYMADVSVDVGYSTQGKLFDLSKKKNKNNSNISYKAAKEFSRHDCTVDLKGRYIDSIGNLK